jgi:hypothetical protein
MVAPQSGHVVQINQPDVVVRTRSGVSWRQPEATTSLFAARLCVAIERATG